MIQDGATSSHPKVQAQLDRLAALGMRNDDFGLDTITELCARLGDPHLKLPPVFHVAGTNGKGSTIAFLRAALEAAGHRVHVYTSPHLVRFNERIRVAGSLIDDDALAGLLEEVLDVADGMKVSFFEATTALAFLAFSRTPADATLLEVGLGGRLDATNIVKPVACAIAALGLDHTHILGKDIATIAGEKAGIAKNGIPLVALAQPEGAGAKIEEVAERVAAPLFVQGRDWSIARADDGLMYRDASGTVDLPMPGLPGPHQVDNLGLAAAMLRHQAAVSKYDLAAGAAKARWPARVQTLSEGPLTKGIDVPIILDGAHNREAAEALSRTVGEGSIILLSGILKNRDYRAMLAPFAGRVTRFAGLPIPGHDDHDTKELCAEANSLFGLERSYPTARIEDAFDWLRAAPPAPGERVLVMGSLYLAGEVLRLNDELPG